MSSSDIFTCVTCNVAFKDSEIQRAHYKTDWHRYNLKRKVADLPAVSAQDFASRVQIQKSQIEDAQNQGGEEMFCKLCSKHFTTSNSFANHKQSKKHKELEQTAFSRQNSEHDSSKSESQIDENLIAIKSDRAQKKAAQLEQMSKKNDELVEEVIEEAGDEDDQDWEDVVEDEDLEFDESKGIDVKACFFCDKKFNSIETKCEHMSKEHSFFIPDLEHVSDLEGLIKFLGIKLGVYHVCLWCSSKCYRDLLSVQKHMQDKGHHKLKFEGETLIEYADFYSYGDESDEEFEVVDDESEMETNQQLTPYSHNKIDSSILTDENYELVLPSGAKIGHRSLFRYYKQSFGHRAIELKQRSNISLKDKYKAIANNSAYTQTEIQKQRKDLAYFQRWQNKMRAKLGWETNKLQKYFRRQNITF